MKSLRCISLFLFIVSLSLLIIILINILKVRNDISLNGIEIAKLEESIEALLDKNKVSQSYIISRTCSNREHEIRLMLSGRKTAENNEIE